MAKGDRDRRLARERAARERRAANAGPPAALPVTEASQTLAAALEQAGLTALAREATKLTFDENYSRAATPLNDLVAHLLAVGGDHALALIERVKAGDFDATPADNAAYADTAQGRAEHAQAAADLAALPAEMRESFERMLTRAAADPRIGARMMAEHVAAMDAHINPLPADGPAPDDHVRPDPATINDALRPLLGQTGPQGERLDTPEILAAVEMVGRTGGREMELGWTHDDRPTALAGWYMQARYTGRLVRVSDQPGPAAAVRAFLPLILDGGRCTHCKRITSTNPAGVKGGDRTLADGTRFTYAEQVAAGICVYRREGAHWVRGCA